MTTSVDPFYGRAYTCARCRSRVDGIHGDDPEGVLTALGWHAIGDGHTVARFCSKTCFEWHRVTAGKGAPVKAVEQLQDHAYQARRAAMNLPSAAPPVRAPSPPAKR